MPTPIWSEIWRRPRLPPRGMVTAKMATMVMAGTVTAAAATTELSDWPAKDRGWPAFLLASPALVGSP
jgi:hypothetical protein